jgi:hypothetical protein
MLTVKCQPLKFGLLAPERGGRREKEEGEGGSLALSDLVIFPIPNFHHKR